MGNDKVFGTESQSNLVEMYARYVSDPKASFFKQIGLGLIQGKRDGTRIHMLEGQDGEKPLELIDCHTSGGVFNLGHHNPEINKALKKGLDLGLDIGDHHLLSEQRALLAKKLAELLPGDISKTMFSVGGGEAIDLAIKLARAHTNQKKVISATRAYHGVTGFALGACAASFKDPFLWNSPDNIQVDFGDIESFKKVIDDKTACVLFETIPATGGILIPPSGYFAEVRELCDDHGAIMIADEVQSGLGRTGELWGIYGGLYKREKIIPDCIVLAKGMSSGVYPLSTTSYKPFLEDVFAENPFLHVSTTGGSELGCFITRTMLDIITKPSFLSHVRQMGSYFMKGLSNLKNSYPDLLVDVRGRGLMIGLEFPDEMSSLFFTLALVKSGVFADYCGNHKVTNKFMPPLVIQKSEVDMILTGIESALMQISQ